MNEYVFLVVDYKYFPSWNDPYRKQNGLVYWSEEFEEKQHQEEGSYRKSNPSMVSERFSEAFCCSVDEFELFRKKSSEAKTREWSKKFSGKLSVGLNQMDQGAVITIKTTKISTQSDDALYFMSTAMFIFSRNPDYSW